MIINRSYVLAVLVAVIAGSYSYLFHWNAAGNTEPPIRTIAPGRSITCALKHDESLWCWGWLPHPTDADGDIKFAKFPTRIGGGIQWSHISSGLAHTCGIASGKVYCFGFDYRKHGLFGSGKAESLGKPERISGHGRWRAASSGHYHTCALMLDRRAYCWGRGSNGQLGNGSPENSLIPHAVNGKFKWKAISAGGNHTCAIKLDGTLWCWGANDFGQLGDGTDFFRLAPAFVVGDSKRKWKAVSCGATHTCAVTMEGKPFCWGSNARGELGDGSKHSIYVKEGAPKSVSMAEEVKSITTGEKFTCALSIDDDGFCWGENIDGELGVGTMKDLSLVPMKVKASWKWKEITCGIYSCCGRGKDGRVHCWGAWSTAEARYETRTEPYPIAGDWSTSRSSFSRSALNVFTAIVVILLLITAVKQRHNRPADLDQTHLDSKEEAETEVSSEEEAETEGSSEEESSKSPSLDPRGSERSRCPGEASDRRRRLNSSQSFPPLGVRRQAPDADWRGAAENVLVQRAAPEGEGALRDMNHATYASICTYNFEQMMKNLGVIYMEHYDSMLRMKRKDGTHVSDRAAVQFAMVATLLPGLLDIGLLVLTSGFQMAAHMFRQFSHSLSKISDGLGTMNDTIALISIKIGELVDAIENGTNRLLEQIEYIKRSLTEQLQRERDMEFSERFVKLCNDMLTGGMAACGFFWILHTFRDGILSHLFWRVLDTCGEWPRFKHWYGLPTFILKLIPVSVCNIFLLALVSALLVASILLPLGAYVLYKIKDMLPYSLGKWIPEIRGNEITLLGGGLGLACGSIGAVAVNVIKGDWILWWTLWLVWLGIFAFSYIQSQEWGPIIIPQPKICAAFVIVMIVIFPASMSYLVI